MSSIARIPFSESLLDLDQVASLIVSNDEGKYQLNLSLGLLASDVPVGDNPSADVKKNNRDAKVDTELFTSGKGNIGLKVINDPDGASTFEIVITVTASTKLPGTGFGLERVNISEINLRK